MSLPPQSERGFFHGPDIKLLREITSDEAVRIARLTYGNPKLAQKPTYYSKEKDAKVVEIEYPHFGARLDLVGQPADLANGINGASLQIEDDSISLRGTAIIFNPDSVIFVRPINRTTKGFTLRVVKVDPERISLYREFRLSGDFTSNQLNHILYAANLSEKDNRS